MIRYLLFDLDNTILDFSAQEKRALSESLLHFGITPTDEICARYSAVNDACWKELEKGRLTQEQVKIKRYEILLDELHAEVSPHEMTAYYEDRLCIGHTFLPGAEELLRRLHEKFAVYIITNGTARVQHARIRSSGLDRLTDGIFISREIGYSKPDIAFFDAVFARIPGIRKEETAVIGDSLTSDIQGGIRAGVRTVWFNPARKENNTAIRPDAVLYTLDEAHLLACL